MSYVGAVQSGHADMISMNADYKAYDSVWEGIITRIDPTGFLSHYETLPCSV
jgi:hypothetical protein